jgi:hypothetical protein
MREVPPTEPVEEGVEGVWVKDRNGEPERGGVNGSH